jgi:hypothetical protein
MMKVAADITNAYTFTASAVDVNAYVPNHMNQQTLLLHTQNIVGQLENFILPLGYDGSEAILNTFMPFVKDLQLLASQSVTAEPALKLLDAHNVLIENVYFYYKRAQTNNMKIRALLQDILVDLLHITAIDIEQAAANIDKMTRFMLGKLYMPVVIKDELIDKRFWEQVGPEAYVNIRLLEAKNTVARPGAGPWRRQFVSPSAPSYTAELDSLSEAMLRIRLNKQLTPAERKYHIIQAIHAHQTQDIGVAASNLDTLLIAAEHHVNDWLASQS